MESEPNDSPPSEAIDLGFDTRSFETQHAVSVLQKYHDVMEAQIEEVLRCERVALVAERPENADEEDLQIFWSQQNYLEELFEHDLIPAMRYSFVVLMHIVFETRLRAFCSALQREREIAIAPNDLAGSAIDQARTYLTKLTHIPIGDLPEWQHLRRIQKIRNCIVHAHGFVAEIGKEDEKYLRQLAKQNIGVAINESDARCPHNRRNHFIFDRFAHALQSRGSAFSFIARLHHPGHADHSAVFCFRCRQRFARPAFAGEGGSRNDGWENCDRVNANRLARRQDFRRRGALERGQRYADWKR